MQIPIEILTRMVTRADSGTGVKPRAGPNLSNEPQFAKTLENAVADTETPQKSKDIKPDTKIATNDAKRDKPQNDNDTSAEEAFAAGVMGNQNLVVIILEGDKESATPLIISTEEITPDPPETIVTQSETVTRPEPAAGKPDTAPFKLNTQDAIPAENTADEKTTVSAPESGKLPEAATREENAIKVIEKTVPGREQVSNEGDPDNNVREVTARMPITRTSESQENKERDSGFSEEGNLGPLENENDTAPVKGEKDKTYSVMAKAVRNAAESAPETVNNTPIPLAEGIKPEQFRSNQQMKQATMDAPVRTENLFDEMVSRLETMKTESQSTMSIQLKPEFLGKVALEIAMDATGLHVKISAADSGVRTMLNGQINTLIESLGNKGIEVAEVEVAYTGVDNGAFKESQGDQAQQPHRQRRRNRETEAVDTVAYYAALPFETLEYYLDAGVSSVEYRA